MAFGGPPEILRNLAYVLLGTMDIHEQGFEVLLEYHVVVRATEPTTFSELRKRYAAHRTGLFVGLSQFAGGFFQLQLLGKQIRKRAGRLERLAGMKKDPGVVLAQMNKRWT